MTNLINYITEKQKNNKNFYIKKIKVSISPVLDTQLNIKKLMSMLIKKIPSFLLSNISSVVVGPTDDLERRQLQGMYKNSVIYLSGQQPSELEALDDLVHEVSHSVEEVYNELIYSDGKVENEFLRKREKLKNSLEREGFKVDHFDFSNMEYKIKFDQFLYKEVGYSKLGILASNIFYSPYAATSLREYFANGFEAFYMKENIGLLKTLSPELYKKIIILHNGGINNV